MDVRIANRDNPDQTASSDLGLHCLSRLFCQATIFKILEHLPYCKSMVLVERMCVCLCLTPHQQLWDHILKSLQTDW